MAATGVKCGSCEKTVYPHEPNLALDGRVFHAACAKCKDCGKLLNLSNVFKSTDFIQESFLLCKRHYEERFLRAPNASYKGGWERSEKEGISLVIQKRKSVELDDEEEEEEEAGTASYPPNKRVSFDMSASYLIDEDPENVEVDVSVIEMTEPAESTMDFSEDAGQSLSADFTSHIDAERSDFLTEYESSVQETDDSISLLNQTVNTVQSTEKTTFLDISDVPVAGEEPEEVQVVEEPLEEAEDEPAVVEEDEEEEEPLLEEAEGEEEDPAPDDEEEEDVGEDSVRSRIKALNKNKSKYVPKPVLGKKADNIDVKFFGPNRVTLNKNIPAALEESSEAAAPAADLLATAAAD